MSPQTTTYLLDNAIQLSDSLEAAPEQAADVHNSCRQNSWGQQISPGSCSKLLSKDSCSMLLSKDSCTRLGSQESCSNLLSNDSCSRQLSHDSCCIGQNSCNDLINPTSSLSNLISFSSNQLSSNSCSKLISPVSMPVSREPIFAALRSASTTPRGSEVALELEEYGEEGGQPQNLYSPGKEGGERRG